MHTNFCSALFFFLNLHICPFLLGLTFHLGSLISSFSHCNITCIFHLKPKNTFQKMATCINEPCNFINWENSSISSNYQQFITQSKTLQIVVLNPYFELLIFAKLDNFSCFYFKFLALIFTSVYYNLIFMVLKHELYIYIKIFSPVSSVLIIQ